MSLRPRRAICHALAMGALILLLGVGHSQSWAQEGGRLRTLSQSFTDDALGQLEAARPTEAPNWQVEITSNFRILHINRSMAMRVARAAEQARTAIAKLWTGAKKVPRWEQRCDIYLYPSFREMNAMTGGDPKAGSTSVKPSQLYRGRILSRRVNFAANDPGLLDATIPHEITHLVLGDLLSGEVPLWANEGAATVAEPYTKQRRYRALLGRHLARGRGYQLRGLMNLKGYPDGGFKGLFYAQSNSVVRFLLSMGTHADFLDFLELAQTRGYDWALRYVYKIAGFDDLQRRWVEFARH